MELVLSLVLLGLLIYLSVDYIKCTRKIKNYHKIVKNKKIRRKILCLT